MNSSKVACGLIFAHTFLNPLGAFNKHRVTASVPFGGRYRVIDFVLSSMVNSGVGNVGVIVNERYNSLFDHLGSGKAWNLSRKSSGGLAMLLPNSLSSIQGNTETSGAGRLLRSIVYFKQYIGQNAGKYVVMSESNIIANLRIDDAIREHEKSGKEVSVVCLDRYVGEPRYGVYFTRNEMTDRYHMDIHPEKSHGLEALGIYIIDKDTLLNMIEYAENNMYRFSDEVIFRNLTGSLSFNICMHEGYAAKIETLRGYYRHNMDLLSKSVRTELFNQDRPIYTKLRDEKPAYYAHGCSVKNSLVADGCVIKGFVENSILSRSVVIEEGAVVRNCVLMQDTKVKKGASLSYVMTDKNVYIGSGTDLKGNALYPVAIEKNAKL